MKENEKHGSNEQPAPEKPAKELTEQQIQQRRKMIVFPLMLLVFAAIMWLIFAPSGGEEATEQAGLNTSLPTPEQSGIVADKRDAYVQQEMKAKQEAKMFSLGEEPESEEERAAREERELRMAPKPVEYYEAPSRFESGTLHSSVGAYHDLNRQIGSFYEETQNEAESDREKELQERIDRLEAQLEDEQARQSAEEQQLALIEKSYQLASKYMNGGQNAGGAAEAVQTTPTGGASRSGRSTVQPVAQVRREVVSYLAAPMPDSVFVAEFTKPRNWGFNTAAGNENPVQKNSIGACIYRTTTVTDGKEVPLRLTEPMRAGGVLIPANTVLTGTARIDGERMMITVNAVQYRGSVIPVELLVYDMDGGEGISVPSSDEISAVKEIAANAGSGLGSSITITDDAGTQLLSDLGRSVIQGTAQYVGQKMRQVKVTLKAGYRVLLLPPLE